MKICLAITYTDGLPDVDLVTRSGAELRPSNFMLWQTAYSEYYFTPAFPSNPAQILP